MGQRNPVTVFIYPSVEQTDAVKCDIELHGRYAKRNDIRHAWKHEDIDWGEAEDPVAVPVTSERYWTRDRIMHEMRDLYALGVPMVCLHHNDHGQPDEPYTSENRRFGYPSACWTEIGVRRLERYGARLVRLPTLPRKYDPPPPGEVVVGTWGHLEPKKKTVEMCLHVRGLGLPFVVWTPHRFYEQYRGYYDEVSRAGGDIRTHGWHEFEFMTRLTEATHFLFYPAASKGGTGGGSTTPQKMAYFGRPVCLVDDEDTYKQDGYGVVRDLSEVTVDFLASLSPPSSVYGPDEYVEALRALARGYER